MQLRSGWRKRVDDERSTGVNLRNFSGLWSTVKTLSHMSYLIGGTGANQRNLSSARSALLIASASWPFRDDLVGAVVPNGRRPFLTAETLLDCYADFRLVAILQVGPLTLSFVRSGHSDLTENLYGL